MHLNFTKFLNGIFGGILLLGYTAAAARSAAMAAASMVLEQKEAACSDT